MVLVPTLFRNLDNEVIKEITTYYVKLAKMLVVCALVSTVVMLPLISTNIGNILTYF